MSKLWVYFSNRERYYLDIIPLQRKRLTVLTKPILKRDFVKTTFGKNITIIIRSYEVRPVLQLVHHPVYLTPQTRPCKPQSATANKNQIHVLFGLLKIKNTFPLKFLRAERICALARLLGLFHDMTSIYCFIDIHILRVAVYFVNKTVGYVLLSFKAFRYY